MSKIFKPNLIPNSKTTNPIDIPTILKKLGRSIGDYIISFKKDGCRIEIENDIKTRSMKPVESTWIRERYAKLLEVCKENGIILEGEFYAHGMSFREICRFFKTTDVTDPKHVKKLEADCYKFNLKGTVTKPIWSTVTGSAELLTVFSKGHIPKFEQDWPGRSVEWMSTYHEDLKIWPFDCVFVNYPETPYHLRMNWLIEHISNPNGLLFEFRDILSTGSWFNVTPGKPSFKTFEEVQTFYNNAVEDGWEGLVLAHRDRTYKNGRSTANSGEIFKMKEDKLEFDGEVLGISEGTVAIEGAPKTTNELGRSVTSKLAEHRKPSGMASGIDSLYEGHPINVSFEGYSHEELRDILENKDKYIGKWFHYTGMKKTKNVPRHAHCSRNPWRDEK